MTNSKTTANRVETHKKAPPQRAVQKRKIHQKKITSILVFGIAT